MTLRRKGGEVIRLGYQIAMLALVAPLFSGLACDRVQSAMMDRNIDRVLEGNRADWLQDDAMHVVLCGTGAPLLDLERAGPCTAVIAGGKMYLVDTGPGSTERSLQYRLPLADLDGVLLTHFHSDHIGELGEAMTQSWLAGRSQPLDVYGPTGVSEVVRGFSRAYARDQVYRNTHHTEEFLPKAGARMQSHTVVVGPGKDMPVFERNGVRVTAIEVDHAPVAPAIAYRFEYNGRSVVISGDTDYSANLARASQGADLLVHEVLVKELIATMSERLRERGAARQSKLAGDVLDYHASPAEAVKVAREAEVDTLVFSHLVPPLPGFMAERVFLGNLGDQGDLDVVLGEDGLHFRLPPGGGIEQDSLE